MFLIILAIGSFFSIFVNVYSCSQICYDSNNAYIKLYQEIEDYLSNLLTIQSYNQFKKEDNNITTHNKEYQESNKNIARCSLSGHLIGIFIIIVFLFSIMYRSYTLVKTNKIKRTDFMSLYFIVTSILGSLIYLSDLFQDLAIEYNNLLDIEKISGLNLFNDEPYINPEIKYPKIKTDSLITVHDLEYRYPKSDT